MSQTFLDKYLYAIRYLSLWVIGLVLAHRYTFQIFNLQLLAITIFVGGFYIAFIYPRYYEFHYLSKTLTIDNVFILTITEVVFHLLTLLFVLYIYGDTYNIISIQTLNSILLLILYILIVDLEKTYKLTFKNVLHIILIIIVTKILLSFTCLYSKN